MGERKERQPPGKESPKKTFRWLPAGADVFSGPGPWGRERLGSVGEVVERLGGFSPRRSKNGRSILFEIWRRTYVTQEDAVYYFVSQLGWVRKPPSRRQESGTGRIRKEKQRVLQQGLGGEFSRVSRVSLQK